MKWETVFFKQLSPQLATIDPGVPSPSPLLIFPWLINLNSCRGRLAQRESIHFLIFCLQQTVVQISFMPGFTPWQFKCATPFFQNVWSIWVPSTKDKRQLRNQISLSKRDHCFLNQLATDGEMMSDPNLQQQLLTLLWQPDDVIQHRTSYMYMRASTPMMNTNVTGQEKRQTGEAPNIEG